MDGEIVNSIPEDPIQREIDQLDESNKKEVQNIRKMEARAAQNLNLYFIFQAVILASVTSGASSPRCHRWWIPFTLSFLVAVQNLFTFASAMYKVVKSREELDQDTLDLAFIKKYRVTRAQLNQVLPGAPFDQLQHGSQVAKHGNDQGFRPKPGSISRWKRRLLAYSSVALFVGFSVAIMYGCYILLCHSNGEKCVKVC